MEALSSMARGIELLGVAVSRMNEEGAAASVPLSLPSPEPDGLLTPQQAADWLRCRPKTLANMRTRGDGPAFHRVGSRVRYRVEDLRAWAERHRATSTTLAPRKRRRRSP